MFSMPSFHEPIDRKDASLPPLQSTPRLASNQRLDETAERRVGAGQAVRSPCNGTCVLSPHDETCLGCLRTKAEITDWMGASEEERARIVQRCGERRGTSQGDQKTGDQKTGDQKTGDQETGDTLDAGDGD
jgi:predicted Fe-S protein YdhL (DUF1289 family)